MVLSIFKKYKIIFFISLIFGLLYLHRLTQIPSSLYSDETTVGYNAFSILQTGMDEYGQKFPILFRLFGAYTPPLFIYSIIPFIYFFGLNAFSLRLLSVISTVGLIIIVYLFSKKLKLFSNRASLIACIVFASSPWVFFNSRLGYEVTLGYFLYYLGVLFIWLDWASGYLSFWGLVFLSLSTYAAHTERYLVPIFVVLFLLTFRKKLFKKSTATNNYKKILICLITQVPHFLILFTPAFWVKNQSFSSVNFQVGIWDFINQLLVYYSPQTYFGKLVADINLQHFIPELSLFFSWQIVFFFTGLYFLLKQKASDSKKLIFLLLLISPLPGAFSGHFISIQRVLPMIVPVVLIIALGIEKALQVLSSRLLFVFVLLFTFSFFLLYRSYFLLLPGQRNVWWNYGAQEIASFIKMNPQSTIIVDNSRDQALYSPIVFYLAFDPKRFQNQFIDVQKHYYQNPPYSSTVLFGNATTRAINWEQDSLQEAFIIGDSLAISASQAEEHFLSKVKDIVDQTGKVHYQIFKTNPALKIQDNAKKIQKQYN